MADLAPQFWTKVNKNGPIPAHRPDLGPCWEWTAAKDAYGYGSLRIEGRVVKAHVWAWEDANGPMPEGVRPSHLEPVAHAENVRRGEAGKHNAIKTHCPLGHLYDEANTRVDAQGRRHCRACHRKQNRDWCRARANKGVKAWPAI